MFNRLHMLLPLLMLTGLSYGLIEVDLNKSEDIKIFDLNKGQNEAIILQSINSLNSNKIVISGDKAPLKIMVELEKGDKLKISRSLTGYEYTLVPSFQVSGQKDLMVTLENTANQRITIKSMTMTRTLTEKIKAMGEKTKEITKKTSDKLKEELP